MKKKKCPFADRSTRKLQMISRGVYSTERYFSSRLFEKLAFHATAEKETLLSRRYSYASYNALLDYRAFFCEIITRKREREREREKRKREKQKRKLFVLTPGDRMQFCRGVFTCGTFDAWKTRRRRWNSPRPLTYIPLHDLPLRYWISTRDQIPGLRLNLHLIPTNLLNE